MKYYLLLFTYLFFSCASQGAPTGGPIDSVGPKVLNVSPNNNSQLSDDDKIIISFDELINPLTVVNAIEATPNNNFSYKVSGKKIIISSLDKWPNANVLKIKLSRYISDYQNNFMSSPIELFYFNSSNPSNKMITGDIIDGESNLFELGLYKIQDSDYQLIEKTESNQFGLFEFKYLDEGKYFIVAVSDSLVNIENDIRFKRYGMISDSFIDLFDNDTIYTSIKIDNPLEKLFIKSFNQINNNFGYIIYNTGKKEPFMIPESEDSLFINIQLENRLESYYVDYSITLDNIIDTIPPAIESFKILNNKAQIILSEPIQHSDTKDNPQIFYLKDSIGYSIDYDFINPFTITFPVNEQFIPNVFLSSLQDLYNNTINDTLSLSINNIDLLNEGDINGGNVYGSIIYDGINEVVVKAEGIDSDILYYSFSDKNSNFSITNMTPGFYRFSAFEFLGGYDSTQYFSGLWDPISPAAKFSIYPQNLEIRKHWDIKDMIMEIK